MKELLPRTVRALLVLVLAIGVVCQFLQYTDPVFPLLYFTIDSAVLMAVIVTVPRRGAWHDSVRGAATVGVIISAIIYATVIIPASESGQWFAPHDDYYVRTANLLIHGVAPFFAVADFLLRPYPQARIGPTLGRWVLFPLAYFVIMGTLDATGVAEMPYPFLRLSDGSNVAGVVGAVAALAVLFAAVCGALLAGQRGAQSLRRRKSERAAP